MPGLGINATAATSDEWITRNDTIHAYYAGLRDKYEPGKPQILQVLC
jgi:hypothetical protein